MFTYNTLNELTFHVCKQLLETGNRLESRNGNTLELCDKEIFLTNPKNRHLYLEGRKSNIYACLAEIFWIMSGTNVLEPLMTTVLPRCTNYSDDGKTWTNGYGPKLYNHGNLRNVLQSFLADGKNARRAVMGIWTPDSDTIESLNKKGFKEHKDISCNNFIYFWIRDNKLNCKVCIRSNDVLWGLSAINIPEWTFLQEVVLRVLQTENPEVFCDVELGYYHHSVISLHVYDETVKQAQDLVCLSENKNRFEQLSNYPILMGNVKHDMIQTFFREIYDVLCGEVKGQWDHTIEKVFEHWNVPKNNNQLYGYAKLVEGYIGNKTGKETPLDIGWLSPDLRAAVVNNKFTPRIWL